MAIKRNGRNGKNGEKKYTPLTDPEFRKSSLAPIPIEFRKQWLAMYARYHEPHAEVPQYTDPNAIQTITGGTPVGEVTEIVTIQQESYWRKSGNNIYYYEGNIAVGDAPNDTNTIYAKGNILIQSDSAQAYLKISNKSDTARDPVIVWVVGATPVIKYTMGVDDSLNDEFVIGSGDGLGASVIFSISPTRGNVLVGLNAGYSRETVSPYLTQSVAIGEDALYYASGDSPVGNIAIGYRAGKANTTGARNIYIGYLCGDYGSNSQAGNDNVLIGKGIAYQSATVINSNVIIGASAAASLITGSQNCLIGDNADALLSSGGYNTGMGYQTMRSNISGARNVALGCYAGWYETGSDKLWIDNRARASLVDARTKALIYGIFADAIADQYLYFNANISTALPITSTLADGTAPFTITSTTVNTNLNADMIDGIHASGLGVVVWSSIASNPGIGEYRIVGLRLNSSKHIVVTYDDVPAAAPGVYTTILSNPTSGEYRIKALRLDSSKRIVVLYDNVAET